MKGLIEMVRYLGFSTAAADDDYLYDYLAHGELIRDVGIPHKVECEVSIRRSSAKVHNRFVIAWNRRWHWGGGRKRRIHDGEFRFDVINKPAGSITIWKEVKDWIDRNTPAYLEQAKQRRDLMKTRFTNKADGHKLMTQIRDRLPGYSLDSGWGGQSELDSVFVKIRVPFTTVDEVVKCIEELTHINNRRG